MTKRVEELINALEGSGAVGATQNMIGEAVHAVFEPEDIKRGVKTTSKLKESCFILVSDLNFEGVKLL